MPDGVGVHMEKVIIGKATMYHGNCFEILPTLPVECSVITDPPYGVGFKYNQYDDTEENFANTVMPVVTASIERFTATICMMSMKRMWLLPPAKWVLCWAKPGSVRRNAVCGFSEWEPVFVWGKAKFANDYKYLPDIASHAKDKPDHPCPKPEKLMQWLVLGTTGPVVDPFMGSGTTGIAAVKEDREFIGCEIDRRYFDEACERIDRAQHQGKLFGSCA
jgi:DNA modification methylase